MRDPLWEKKARRWERPERKAALAEWRERNKKPPAPRQSPPPRCGHPAERFSTDAKGHRVCLECRAEASRANRRALTPEQRAHRNMTARVRNQERRARLRGMFVERVDPLVLFERDEGICGICWTPVDPLDFHVDHIIPLDPGEHSYANTQVAHPPCNLRKHRSGILRETSDSSSAGFASSPQ